MATVCRCPLPKTRRANRSAITVAEKRPSSDTFSRRSGRPDFQQRCYIPGISLVRVLLPNLGMETVHHVHADDVAAAFVRAVGSRATAIGESFHVVSPAALTLRGYAERLAAWFGRKALLKFLPWEEWRRGASEEDARLTWDHIAHSPNCSIEKARRLLAYEPRYGSLEAVQEAVTWLIAENRGIWPSL